MSGRSLVLCLGVLAAAFILQGCATLSLDHSDVFQLGKYNLTHTVRVWKIPEGDAVIISHLREGKGKPSVKWAKVPIPAAGVQVRTYRLNSYLIESSVAGEITARSTEIPSIDAPPAGGVPPERECFWSDGRCTFVKVSDGADPPRYVTLMVGVKHGVNEEGRAAWAYPILVACYTPAVIFDFFTWPIQLWVLDRSMKGH